MVNASLRERVDAVQMVLRAEPAASRYLTSLCR